MSGWGCRHQYEDQCLRLRKECKPGVPGCVLHGKVTFIHAIEPEPTGAPQQRVKLRPAPARKRR
jgi:hypothetical protein